MKYGEATIGPKCPECGGTTTTRFALCLRSFLCPTRPRWEALRPKDPRPEDPHEWDGWRRSADWLRDHPDEGELVRPLELAEQVDWWYSNGVAVEYIRLIRQMDGIALGDLW